MSDVKDLEKKYELAWDKYTKSVLEKVFALSDNYIDFMSKCKTERECITEFVTLAEKNGYKNIDTYIKDGAKLKAGDKVYSNCMGKTLALFLIGTEPIEKG